MKIIKVLAVILLIPIFLSGCFNSSGEYHTPDEIAILQAKGIIICIQNKDSERLKSLFCEEIKNRDSIDSEIEKLFNFIDGEIISYDEPYVSGHSKSTTPEGIEMLGVGGNIYNIKTDTGKNYVLYFYSYHINKEDEDSVGVTIVTIFDEDTYDPEEGYPDYGKYSIVSD